MEFFFFIVLGAIWGSFANVCIYRIPKNLGISTGRSFCTKCKKKIQWFDNIPIFSYVILGSKCRFCKKQIDPQYLVVEIILACTFALIYFFYGISITTLLLTILSLFFIIIFFIDLKHFIIPDILSFPLMALGLLKSFIPNLDEFIFPTYLDSILGGVFGYVIIYAIILFYRTVKKKEGMGLGDAKLMAVIGFWFGLLSIPFVMFASSLLALLIVLPSLLSKKRQLQSKIPFGPYLIIGSVIFIFFKEPIVNYFFL